ncbi:MAG: YlbF family regulator [Clostridia bacterium]|nr:YlbF family regulator [Clostridia bacterium]
MDIYEEAARLAEQIHESDQVQTYQRLRDEVMKDPGNKKLIEHYKEMQFEAQKQMMAGQEPQPELMDKLTKMGEVLNFNPKVTEFFAAEYNMRMLAHDMLKIIADACGLEDNWLEE